MQLYNFITSLLQRLRKDDILEDLRVTHGELLNGVIPSYESATEFFQKFESEEIKSLSSIFYRNYDLPKSAKNLNFVAEVSSRLKFVKDNIEFINSEIEELLESDIIKDGLTAKKAILIRAAEQLSFITRFSVDLLNYVYIKETKKAGGQVYDLISLTEKKIVKNVAAFATMLTVFGNTTEKFKKMLQDLPDVVMNEKTYSALAGVYSESKLDPLSSIFVAEFNQNPIYHFRLMIAEWQANRYKGFKDKKRMLELRLLNLKLVSEKNNDPRIEKEIEYMQSRIEAYEYKMAKMEESVK